MRVVRVHGHATPEAFARIRERLEDVPAIQYVAQAEDAVEVLVDPEAEFDAIAEGEIRSVVLEEFAREVDPHAQILSRILEEIAALRALVESRLPIRATQEQEAAAASSSRGPDTPA